MLGLDASTDFKAVITNHFGQKYTQDVTSDINGTITVDITYFPDGFFNPNAGIYTLEVTDPGGAIQTMVIGYTDYLCLSFDIYELQSAN